MTEAELPNKCMLCALRQNWPLETDPIFQKLNILYNAGIINKRFVRLIDVSGNNEGSNFCLVSHPAWGPHQTKIPCDKWQLDINETKSDALNLNLAEEATKAAKETERLTIQLNSLTVDIRNMTKTIKVCTIIVVFLTILSICILLK